MDLFADGRDAEWRNRLIWGDKQYVLPALLPEFAGKVDLIYVHPPFDPGADFPARCRWTAKRPRAVARPRAAGYAIHKRDWRGGLSGT